MIDSSTINIDSVVSGRTCEHGPLLIKGRRQREQNGDRDNQDHTQRRLAFAATFVAAGALLLFGRGLLAVPIPAAFSRPLSEDHVLARGRQPNPPPWPADSVRIFDPSEDAQLTADAIRALTSELTNRTTGHFSDKRVALLFRPGVYANLSFEVGYYVQVSGLGWDAGDVRFRDGGPRCGAPDRRPNGAGSLDAFWRSVENVRVRPGSGEKMVWAVSQASPLRRLRVEGDLDLFEGYCRRRESANGTAAAADDMECGAYYASGGFMANVEIDGYTNFGSQQQFLSRNVDFRGGSGGGAWNLVFVGCRSDGNKAKDDVGSDLVRTVDGFPRVVVEKPYVVAVAGEDDSGGSDGGDRFKLVVPTASFPDDAASSLSGSRLVASAEDRENARDFSCVYLARPTEEASSPYEAVQEALDAGLDVVFSPGVYRLERTITVSKPGSVLLGLGLATLVAPDDGSPALHVLPFVVDVRVAGLILEANVLLPPTPSRGSGDGNGNSHYHLYRDRLGVVHEGSTLLAWGSPGVGDPGDPRRPGVISDVFCRVGGSSSRTVANPADASARHYSYAAEVDVMVRLHSGNIVGDHLWLWRPDHLGLNHEHKKPAATDTAGGGSEYHHVRRGECPCQAGLHVHGDNVTMYGLAVEHTTGDAMVSWIGQNGLVRFYQSELPYDVTPEEYGGGGDDGKRDVSSAVSYLVDDAVVSHDLAGGGVYSFFRDHDVTVDMAFRHPTTTTTTATRQDSNNSTAAAAAAAGMGDAVRMTNVFTRFLNGKGSIRSVVNMRGSPVTERNRMSRVEVST